MKQSSSSKIDIAILLNKNYENCVQSQYQQKHSSYKTIQILFLSTHVNNIQNFVIV
jgi:hypothetical protein